MAADDIERAYSPNRDLNFNRVSVERFLTWQAALARWRKAARLMVFWIRLA